MILHWSKQTYLDPITKREEDIKKKVKEDISKKIAEFEEEIGDEQFVDEIYDIMAFRKNLRESKIIFGGYMVPIAVLVCIISIVLVSIWDYGNNLANIILFDAVILLTLFLIGLFFKLRRFENQLSRFLEGESPSDIMAK